MNVSNSKELLPKVLEKIPLGSQTLSKTTSQFTQKYAPNFVDYGKGPYLYDVDGNRWIDFIAALGPIVLGYDHPEVIDAISNQIKKGMSYSLSSKLEVELAKKLTEIVPGVEKVRFGKNGSDVAAASVRACRAITGREKVAICGYHGWQDWYIGSTTKNKGVPQCVRDLSLTFQYNKIETLEQLFKDHPGQIACVIIESIGINEPKDSFLEKLKDLTHKNGALLVFDEIVNGFRLRPGGGGQYYGVVPDFVLMGKAMGNGAPMSAIGGSVQNMKIFEEIFFSFTFGGDCIGISAALKTIEVLERENGYEKIFAKGTKLKTALQELIQQHGMSEHLSILGLSHHFVISFAGIEQQSLLHKSYFQQECLRRGLLFIGVHFPSLCHTDEVIDETIQIYKEVFKVFAEAVQTNTVTAKLESEPVKPVFRSRV